MVEGGGKVESPELIEFLLLLLNPFFFFPHTKGRNSKVNFHDDKYFFSLCSPMLLLLSLTCGLLKSQFPPFHFPHTRIFFISQVPYFIDACNNKNYVCQCFLYLVQNLLNRSLFFLSI